jgi:vacuolar-type H+-ATPase subunit I/STV1
MDELWLQKLIVKSLKDCIRAHGDITVEWIGSAAKRIANQIYGELKAVASKDELFQAKIAEIKKEIHRMERRNKSLAKTIRHWMEKAGANPEDKKLMFSDE